jgi:flavin-binding protein dodecin
MDGLRLLSAQRDAAAPPPGSATMSDHVYKIVEIVGSSPDSIEEAVQRAIARASETLREIRWFEIVSTRGHVEDGRVAHYQVTLRIGFTLEG